MANEKKGLVDITTGVEVSDANANGILDLSSTEVSLLSGIVSVSTGVADNDKFVTQGYVDDAVESKDTFIELTDTPSSYTASGAIYNVNATTDGVRETSVILTEGVNTFNMAKGTASLDIAAGAALNIDANLDVESASAINQDLTTDSITAQLAKLTIDNLVLDANTLSSTSGDIILAPFSNNVIIGTGAIGIDYTLTFDGETNDGVITWQEDEDNFDFSCGLSITDSANSSIQIAPSSTTIDFNYGSNITLSRWNINNVDMDFDFQSSTGSLLYLDSGQNNVGIGISTPDSNFQLHVSNAFYCGGDIGSTGSRISKGWFTDLEITNMPTVGGTAIDSTFQARAPVSAPALPASTGTQGDWSYSSGYMYHCVATNTWVRWAVVTSWT